MRLVVLHLLMLLLIGVAGCAPTAATPTIPAATPPPGDPTGALTTPGDVATRLVAAFLADEPDAVQALYDPSSDALRRDQTLTYLANTQAEFILTTPQQPGAVGAIQQVQPAIVEQSGTTALVRVPIQHAFGATEWQITLIQTPDGWRWQIIRWKLTHPKPTPTR